MRHELQALLRCPDCDHELELSRTGPPPGATEGPGQVREGALRCGGCDRRVPVVDGIPRFVPSDDYAGSFSFEWNRFAVTQLDSARGWTLSEERFQQSLDFPLHELKGKLVLDAGCGMGRFAEIVAKYGGTVVGADISYAVDAAARNLAPRTNAHVIQADLRQLPLRKGSFDLVYSLGVLHHTPDARRTFEALLPYVKPGGKVSVTLYSGYNPAYVISTRFWRKLAAKISSKVVYYASHLAIPAYYLYRVPLVGLVAMAVFPISMHPDPEWRLLDTFDCYTPKYQSYHTHVEVYRWFRENGLTDIVVLEPAVSFIATRPV